MAAYGAALETLRPEAFSARVDDCRAALVRSDGGSERDNVACFALAREATRRVLGFAHHPVQIMGARVLLEGNLAEMETGEGKTITALLAVAARALGGAPVHVVTVNEYLSQRDAEQLRPVYALLKLSVGLALPDQSPDDRRTAYAQDVTYCTNKDLVFDYLRDRMAIGQRRGVARRLIMDMHEDGDASRAPLLLRGLHFAIVDEVDSILIDEARTPLILSRNTHNDDEDAARLIALDIAVDLVEAVDFRRSPHGRQIDLLAPASARIRQATEALAGNPLLARASGEMVSQALSALHCYAKDIDYIVDQGKILIVDEFTGRVMPDRSWENGLHQMVELKEGCVSTAQRLTIARISYQRFFQRYLRLSGMSGTISEAAGELYEHFGMRTVRIAPNRRSRRRDCGMTVLVGEAAKLDVIASSVRRHGAERGRPVLIGTRSVEVSEKLSATLAKMGLDHVVLNARQTKHEAEIVAQGGQAGRVTVATNMAGRGTDIRLSTEAADAGGLHVILTEYHESARVDRQLFGRSARQGNPGSFEAIVASDDKIFTDFLLPHELAWLHRAATTPDGPKRRTWLHARLRRIAQSRAERANRRIRDMAVKRDIDFESAMAFAGKGE